MRTLLIVDSYLPEPKATGPMFHSLSRELTARGHRVTILTLSSAIAERVCVRDEEGVRIIRVRSPKMKGIHLVRRGLTELVLSRLVWMRAKREIDAVRADLIAFYSPTIFWAPLVRRLKRRWGAKTVLILRDIFPRWALDAGQMRRGPHYSLLQYYAEFQFRVADRIGVQSPNNATYLRAEMPQYLDKIGVLFNWTGIDSNGAIEDPRPQLGIAESTTVFLYGGNLGTAQDPDLLLETARVLRGADAFLLIIGEGFAAERVQQTIAQEQMSNIAFWPSVSQERFLAIARACDVGLVALNPTLSTHNFPGKLLTYAAAAIPVLASVNRGNDLRDVLESTESGLCTWADEPEQFIAAARTLADDKYLRQRLASNVRQKLATVFSVERAADFILEAAR